MFGLLLIVTSLYLRMKLQQAGFNSLVLKIFMAFTIISVIVYETAFFFKKFYPGRSGEILYAAIFTVIIIFLLASLSFGLVDLLTCFKKFTRSKIIIALAITSIISIYGFCEAYFVRPVFIELKTNKLPVDIKKIRLVYLTDVHLGGIYTRWHFDRVMNIVNEAKPDIFILAGDIVDGDISYREYELNLLRAAAENSKYGAFAVNGNHEYYHIFEEDVENIIREYGFDYLIDERRELQNLNMVVIGFDDKKFGWISPYLHEDDHKKFILVIKHRPGLPNDAENNFDLQISGHTHNGQFWPLGYFKNLSSKSSQGLSYKSGGVVYVSSGAGFNGPAMRIFARPEVTIIDLVNEQ